MPSFGNGVGLTLLPLDAIAFEKGAREKRDRHRIDWLWRFLMVHGQERIEKRIAPDLSDQIDCASHRRTKRWPGARRPRAKAPAPAAAQFDALAGTVRACTNFRASNAER